MEMIRSFFVLLFLVPVFSDYVHVTTLQNEKQLTCLSSGNSPMYPIPPIQEERDDSSLMSFDSDDEDWVSCDSSQVLQSPVTDLRWEDFATRQTNHLLFTSVRSVAFSAYTPAGFEIFLSENDGNNKIIEIPSSTNRDQWIHYGIYAKNNAVFVVRDNVTISVINGIDPDKIAVKSKNITFWKIHDHSFKLSRKITKKEPTIWKIQPAGKTGFLLYTSLCEKCYLRLTTQTQKNKRMKIIIINPPSDSSEIAKLWEEHEIEIDPYKETTVKIYRGSENGADSGYWAIEPRWLPSGQSSLGFHQKTFRSVLPWGHVCNTLQNQNSEAIKMLENTKFCPIPGKLGRDCDIACSAVLGPNFEYCEHYEICENFKCMCSWGFHGPNCWQDCDQGIWGLGCQNKCEDNCTECNSKSGQCISEEIVSAQEAGIMVYCGIGIVAVATILMAAVIKNQQMIKKSNKEKNILHDMSSQTSLISSV